MSRRATRIGLQHAIADLRKDLSAEIQQTIARELAKLEVVTCSPTPSSTQPPAPTSTTTDKAGVVIDQETGQALYQLIETVEDALCAGRQGRMKAFEEHAQHLEGLICQIDNCLLSQVKLTGQQLN